MDTILPIWKPSVPEPDCGGEVNRPVGGTSLNPRSMVWQEDLQDLLKVAIALGIPRDRAEDLLQDVWITAWKKAPSELGPEGLRRWLYRVVVNRCRLEHRTQRRWRRVLDVVGWLNTRARSPEAADRAESNELHAEVEKALAKLETTVREIVVLRYFCNFDSRQIGEMLDLSGSTVRSHLRIARQQLARFLADWKDHHES